MALLNQKAMQGCPLAPTASVIYRVRNTSAVPSVKAGMMSTIRQHVLAMHPHIRPVPRSNDDVARAHAREHHRLYCNHAHAEDNAGKLAGPNTGRRRPSGWQTGLDVIPRSTV